MAIEKELSKARDSREREIPKNLFGKILPDLKSWPFWSRTGHRKVKLAGLVPVLSLSCEYPMILAKTPSIISM